MSNRKNLEFALCDVYIQGAPIENYQKWKATVLKRCISDLRLVKAKMCLRGSSFFLYPKVGWNFQLFVYNFQSKLPSLKHILALPTQGLKCTVSVLQPFSFKNFQSEHPVFFSCLFTIFSHFSRVETHQNTIQKIKLKMISLIWLNL